jgi:hypothetical protein
MLSGKAVISAGCLALGLALLARSGAAFDPYSKMAYLTSDRPVRLPHVTLGAGTYIFEMKKEVGPGMRGVRVTSRDRSKTYFVAFTRVVPKPADLAPNQSFSFEEGGPGVPQPIAVWYPKDEPNGLRFVYCEHE